MPLAALLLALCPAAAQAAEVTLGAVTNGAFRWRDVAGNHYAASYTGSYNYAQASVTVSFAATGTILRGTMAATNLKPHFAYQFKLEGRPEDDAAANEALGLSGRWWEQTWQGSNGWSAGGNLNTKGAGTSPNPNDDVYISRRGVSNAASPTQLHYRYVAYRPLDYFITDSNGNAELTFSLDSCYHVLWRTWYQPHTASDGQLKSTTFDPDPSVNPAYDTDYPSATVHVFGEWERLPVGGVYLAPGQHDMSFLLTEESFHSVDGPGSGTWAHAMRGAVQFTIVRPVVRATASPPHGASPLPASAEVTCGGSTNAHARTFTYWDITNSLVNGVSVGATNSVQLTRVTNDVDVTFLLHPHLATQGVPKWWLAARVAAWTNDFVAAALGDQDADTVPTWQEYLAGTDPDDGDSWFHIDEVRCVGGTNAITWRSPVSDPSLPPFAVERSYTTGNGWATVDVNAARSPDGTNVWFDAHSATHNSNTFYRVVATNNAL